jgi:hypothetical protein
MGTLPSARTHSYAILGQDGGQSIALASGTLFVFSDTLLVCADDTVARTHPSAPVPVPANIQTIFLANCAAISPENTLEKALRTSRYYHDGDGIPREILPSTDRERFRMLRFWPEHGIALSGEVYLYYLGVQTTDQSTVWGFRNVGVGLARLDAETGECHRFHQDGDWIYWRCAGDDLHIGVQVILYEDFVYVFGSLRHGVQATAFLARVRSDRISDRAAYEYLASCSPSWTSRFDQSCSLGPSATEYSVSYNPYLDRYTMIYIEEYRKRLTMRTAERLWGPYSEPVELIGVPHHDTSELAYLGFEHSHFQQLGGRKIYVTYCEPRFAPGSMLTVTLERRNREAMPSIQQV